MAKNILLVFDEFDPITNYKLKLVSEAQKIVDFDTIVFSYEEFEGGGDRVFQTEEKIFLLSSSLPNTPHPGYLINGDSFANRRLSVGAKVEAQRKNFRGSDIYLLLDSKEYQILGQRPDWHTIVSTAQIILYILPEDRDLMNSYSVASRSLIFINPDPEISKLKAASVLNVNVHNFSPTLIDYMNKSGECAIKRIKSHLSDARFKHSLRVAGTVKQICEVVGVEDSEFCYDVYLAALYHDICKEMPMEMQESIATNILGRDDYVSWKVLHGPVGAWYMKTKYLFTNEDVLEAVSQHTIPGEYPKRITIFLYLADRLEVGKKDRYPEEVYNKAWELIESQKPVEAFNFLINYFHDLRSSK